MKINSVKKCLIVPQDLCSMFLTKKTGTYCDKFNKMLIAGGGGNSMFVNCWAKPSSWFVKTRLSGEAKKWMSDNNYKSISDVPHKFKCNNAKGAKNRKAKGKFLHLDHNPGNVKILELIKDECMKHDPEKENYEDIIREIKKYLSTIQTLDWITVDQDDVRTYGDAKHSKSEKNKMNHEERDLLLNDDFEFLSKN